MEGGEGGKKRAMAQLDRLKYLSGRESGLPYEVEKDLFLMCATMSENLSCISQYPSKSNIVLLGSTRPRSLPISSTIISFLPS